jgi:hypothetical protein
VWALHDLGPTWASNVRALNTLGSVKIYMYSYLYELFDLSSKAGSLRGRNEGIERRGVEASSASQAPWNKKKREGKGLCVETILIKPLDPLEVEVTGKIP